MSFVEAENFSLLKDCSGNKRLHLLVGNLRPPIQQGGVNFYHIQKPKVDSYVKFPDGYEFWVHPFIQNCEMGKKCNFGQIYKNHEKHLFFCFSVNTSFTVRDICFKFWHRYLWTLVSLTVNVKLFSAASFFGKKNKNLCLTPKNTKMHCKI